MEVNSPRDQVAAFRLFRRLLVSYNDFKQAADISALILERHLHDRYPDENRHLLQALNCAMLVAYCRPFSKNRGMGSMLPSLPAQFLRILSREERELHDIARADRNKVLAHSDAAGWKLRLAVIPTRTGGMLVPVHDGIRAPLLQSPTALLGRMAVKLMEAVFEARMAMEPEMKPLLPSFREDGTVTGDEQAMVWGGWTTPESGLGGRGRSSP